MLFGMLKENEKVLLRNFVSLASLKVFNLILPLVTLPYLINVLSFNNYGVIVISLSLKQYFHAFTNYGFNYTATRDIARHRHSERQLCYLYSKYLSSSIFLLIVALFVYVSIISLVPYFYEHKLVFLLSTLILIGQSIFPEWFYRGIEKMYFITFLDITVKTMFTLGVFVFIQEGDDYWKYPLIFGLGYIFVSIVAHFIIIKRFKVSVKFLNYGRIRSCLVNGFPLFINQFVPNLYNNSTGFIVGILLGNYYAGVFGAIRQVVNLLNVLNSVVTSVFFPYLSRNKNSFKSYSKYYLLSFLSVCLSFCLGLPYMLEFVGVDASSFSYAAYYLISGVFFFSIFNVFGTNFLIVRGKDKLVMYIVSICSVTGFFMSWILVSKFGINGAAVNIALCQFLMGFLAFVFYKKHKN